MSNIVNSLQDPDLLREALRKDHWNNDHIDIAIQQKSTNALEIFLEHGWPIDRPLQESNPPPMSIAIDDIRMVEWFISHGADINGTGEEFDMTPLSIAVERASLPIIKLLINYGGSLERGQLLHHAARRTDEEAIAVIGLLLQLGAPGLNSIQYGNWPKKGIYINQLDFIMGFGTPLHIAAAGGNLEMVKFLVDQGADVQMENTHGKRPFDVADKEDIRDYFLSYELSNM